MHVHVSILAQVPLDCVLAMWDETQRPQPVKRRRQGQGVNMRPGVGFFADEDDGGGHLPCGLGATPMIPQYEALPMSDAEVLEMIKKIDPARTLSRQMQRLPEHGHGLRSLHLSG